MKFSRLYFLLVFTLISFIGKSQSDTNHLYLDHIDIHLSDSTEKLLSLVFDNDSNTLVFADTSQCKMLGINRYKTCNLTIRTNKSFVILKDINEYISFINTKYRLSVYLPINHLNCVSAIYTQPDGMILFHTQTFEKEDLVINLENCVGVDAAPVGYTDFEKQKDFKVNHILK